MAKLGFVLLGFLGVGVVASCSASNDGSENFGGAGGSSASGSGASGGFIFGGSAGMGGASGSGLGLDGGCAQASGNAENLPAVILVVLDISGSMDQDAPGGGTKMEVTRDALRGAIPLLPDSTALGTYYYPGPGMNPLGQPCVPPGLAVPVQLLAPPHRQAIDSSLAGITAAGNTPTHDAFVVGAQQLNQVQLPGNKFILLMTDGQPTLGVGCNLFTAANYPLLVQQVQQAAGGGIRTFVVGSPGSEPARDLLSQMATAGGTATPGCSNAGPNYCHFDMTTQPNLAQALTDALRAIAGQALSCVYNIPQDNANVNPELVSIYYTPGGGSQPEEIGKSGDPNNCVDGWRFSDDKKQIILCGATCDRVKADQTGTVNVVFGCRPKFT